MSESHSFAFLGLFLLLFIGVVYFSLCSFCLQPWKCDFQCVFYRLCSTFRAQAQGGSITVEWHRENGTRFLMTLVSAGRLLTG